MTVSSLCVEQGSMRTIFFSQRRENGPCPKCGRPATFRLVDFDSRSIGVACSGSCGQFAVPKPVLDDMLEAGRPRKVAYEGEVAWLFGRGLSIDCGLSWVEPEEWKSLQREERVRKIKATLRVEMNAPHVSTLPIRRFLDFIWKRTVNGWHHLLVTTNWDYLLQREIDRAFPEVSPWPRIKEVFHFNGTVQDLRDDPTATSSLPRRSSFLLEDDPAEQRAQTVEGNLAFNQIIWADVFVVVGMSFECQTDRFLLRHLNAVRDHVPIGKSLWVIVNPDRPALACVCSRIQQALPRARIVPVCRTFTEWCRAAFPELETEGVFRVRRRTFLGQR
jgi:hypothetical protein